MKTNYYFLIPIALCILAIIAIFIGTDMNTSDKLYYMGYFVIGIIFLASCMSPKWIKFVLRVR